MPEIQVFTDHGQKIADFPDGTLQGVDISDMPNSADYVSIETPGGEAEFWGRIVIKQFTPKGEKEGEL